MKKEVMKKWVSALRSGKYRQGKGQLRDPDDHFCCLGVLCDLHNLETGHGKWQSGDYIAGDSCDSDVPPIGVAAWAGLNAQNPSLPSGTFGSETLAQLNDGNVEFADIADHIEEFWSEL